ncbi:hypothetical protein F2P81_015878 [Scophthalmus maximus]|uniref:Uncharacterized protein n=1 Tax=Scophthalmus maximus TaxID=52904 RepID=A0A6A4SAS3_SCOMX|nr:hypothetical protein F2P81_015878 [Scophthalmus maximus]
MDGDVHCGNDQLATEEREINAKTQCLCILRLNVHLSEKSKVDVEKLTERCHRKSTFQQRLHSSHGEKNPDGAAGDTHHHVCSCSCAAQHFA